MGGSNTTPITGSHDGGNPGSYGSLGAPAAGNIPGSRSDATTWTDGSGHLWLFGGWGFDANGNLGRLNDLWQFTPAMKQWAWMGGSSTIPSSGSGNSGVYGALSVPAAGNVPGGRVGAIGWTDSSGRLWLFGGLGYDASGLLGYLNDLWELNPSTSQWVWMGGPSALPCGAYCGQPGVYGTLGVPAAGNVPGGRDTLVAWTGTSGHLWLFGGNGFDANGSVDVLNDLWEYRVPDPGTPSFTLSSSPGSLTIAQGASGTSTVTVTGAGGFSGSATLTASGLPSGVTASFSPNPASGTSVVTLTASSSAAPGSYSPVITGTAGTLTATAGFALGITPGSVNTTTTLTSSANPSTFGQSVTFTAKVSPSAATGTVQFLDGTTSLGTATIAGGSASLTLSSLAVGAHSITAVYSGDANDATSTSAAVAQTVNKLASTVALVSSKNPSTYGQSVTLSATVSPATATGTLQFLDGATSLGTATMAGGSASLTISTFAVGTHSITAVYSGNAIYLTSTSAALAQTVNKLVSSVTLASSAKPSTYGQSVTFTATVSPAAATGTVQFLDGATVLGTATIANTKASLAVSTLAVGAHSINAVYGGDANDLTSTSAALAQTVNKAASSVTLVSSANPSTYGQSVTFTATVSPAAPTGTVQFLDGTTSLGTVTVTGGSASLAISTLAVGAHSITAVYSGDANHTTGTSAALAQTVNKAASSVALATSLNPTAAGQSVTFVATVSPSSATGTVQFLDGTTSLGTVTIASGKASLAISTLGSSVHSITAAYSGATNYATSTSAALSQTVLPGAPTRLTATSVSSTQINLAWTASPTNGVAYSVYSSATSGFTPSASNRIASGLTAVSYSNTGLPASTTHYYVVTAQDSAGESAASNQVSATTPVGPACHVTYSVTSQWPGGFGTALTIQNTGSTAISNWNLTWTWPGNQKITQSWNASYTQIGANATLAYESYNATIAPGATISGMGFNASYSGTNTAPSAFSVNGTLCK